MQSESVQNRHNLVATAFHEYEDIQKQYGNHILQADIDDIIEQEVQFFVWAKPMDWVFSVASVYRKDGKLYLGKEEEFYFENDGWVRDFFDRLK